MENEKYNIKLKENEGEPYLQIIINNEKKEFKSNLEITLEHKGYQFKFIKSKKEDDYIFYIDSYCFDLNKKNKSNLTLDSKQINTDVKIKHNIYEANKDTNQVNKDCKDTFMEKYKTLDDTKKINNQNQGLIDGNDLRKKLLKGVEESSKKDNYPQY